ncbi:MAG TPA: cob(I)yrinic acid a,c-diamide adenosyltransferase [Acidimicrobiia bacterium]
MTGSEPWKYEPPTDDPRPGDLRAAPSVVIVNTGDGKGKSTAAFGVVMRAVARGWDVAVVQFVKSGKWNVGEEATARKLGVDWWTIGEGFSWDSADLSEDEAVAREAWRHAAGVIGAGEHRLVVLDEITYPVNWGWIALDEVVAALRDRPETVNVVLTGRDAPAALVDAADTVTEMRSVKHAYDRGIRAKKGIDY